MPKQPTRRERDYVVLDTRVGLTEHGLAIGVLAAMQSADGTLREELLSLRLKIGEAEEMLRQLSSALEAARLGHAPLTRQ